MVCRKQHSYKMQGSVSKIQSVNTVDQKHLRNHPSDNAKFLQANDVVPLFDDKIAHSKLKELKTGI